MIIVIIHVIDEFFSSATHRNAHQKMNFQTWSLECSNCFIFGREKKKELVRDHHTNMKWSWWNEERTKQNWFWNWKSIHLFHTDTESIVLKRILSFSLCCRGLFSFIYFRFWSMLWIQSFLLLLSVSFRMQQKSSSVLCFSFVSSVFLFFFWSNV